ncbi:MAG: hypothetical protein KDA83_01245 [Planctomycetales bacterium]|nr:hypothetical protein [Planctomycetales bacterium]
MTERQRLTYHGSEVVETRMYDLLAKIGDEARRLEMSRAGDGLLLIGGYGRGEGGVERTELGERPHNNLDLVLVTRKRQSNPVVRGWLERMDQSLASLRDEGEIGIDLSALHWKHLSRTRGLLLGFDARHGHSVIVGQPDLLSRMSPYPVSCIAPTQIEELVVNRGTLLIINRYALRRHASIETLSPLGRLLAKHAMKAIVGYGDAWLYHRSMYHWSYVEKLRRMNEIAHVDSSFCRRYIQAATFRLLPNYAALQGVIDREWNASLLRDLARTHAQFANQPFSPRSAAWTGELDRRVRRDWSPTWTRPRRLAKQIARAARHLRTLPESVPSRMHWAGLGPRGWLRLAFPYVAYGLGTTLERETIATVLGAAPEAAHDENAFDEAYLNLWSRFGDTNFRHVLTQHADSLTGAAS